MSNLSPVSYFFENSPSPIEKLYPTHLPHDTISNQYINECIMYILKHKNKHDMYDISAYIEQQTTITLEQLKHSIKIHIYRVKHHIFNESKETLHNLKLKHEVLLNQYYFIKECISLL